MLAAYGEKLPIPEIVAIGGQSDGKSSLLEAFLGFRFNVRQQPPLRIAPPRAVARRANIPPSRAAEGTRACETTWEDSSHNNIPPSLSVCIGKSGRVHWQRIACT